MEIKKSDFIFFKNEVLEDIKKLENRINNKIIVNSDILVEKINLNKNNISDNNKKIFEMMKLISNEEEKIKINSSLNSFKAKIDEFVLLNDTKLTYLEKQFNEISFKYDKIFIKNLTCPGFIGKACEFSNARSFFEFTHRKLKELSGARDLQNKDIKMYKEKLESLISQFKSQIKLIEAKFSLYIQESLSKLELRTKERFKEIENKIIDIKAENTQLSLDIKKKMEDIDLQWEKMYEFKNEISDKIEKNISNMKKENKNFKNENDIFKTEFKSIQKKFNEINNIVKDIKRKSNASHIQNLMNVNNKISNNININKLVEDRNIILSITHNQNKILEEDLSHIRYNIENNNQKNIFNNNNQNIILESIKQISEENKENILEKEIMDDKFKDNKNINYEKSKKEKEENKEDIINKVQINDNQKVNNDKLKIKMINTDNNNNKNRMNLNHKIDETKIHSNIIKTGDINNNDIKVENINSEINLIKNKEINDVNLRKINNTNYNKINNNFSSMKNNFNFSKKAFIRKEKTEILPNGNLGNKQNDITYNLIEKNFKQKIKEETDKMNKTYNNKFIISRRNSNITNKAMPTISPFNNVNTKSKFYEHKNKKNLSNNELNYNSDNIENVNISSIGVPELKIMNFNKVMKNQKSNILNSIKMKRMRNERILFNHKQLSNDNVVVDNDINRKNLNDILIGNENLQTDSEQYLNKEEFYANLNETKQSINELYFKLNKKIHKLTRQIKNLTAEIFNYYYTQKLNNKFSTCVTNSNSVRNATQNSGIDLSANANELKSNRKLNLKFFSEINDNFTFTEEQKMNSKELLKKIDSFLIKKFKES